MSKLVFPTGVKSQFTADSLSRSYFDVSRYENKSFTPDSMTGGRSSADGSSADPQQQQQQHHAQQQQQQQMQHHQQQQQQQHPQQQQQQQQQGFDLQAYYR